MSLEYRIKNQVLMALNRMCNRMSNEGYDAKTIEAFRQRISKRINKLTYNDIKTITNKAKEAK